MKKSVSNLSKEIAKVKKFNLATFSLTILNTLAIVYLILNV